MMCVGEYKHHNQTEKLMQDPMFKGKVREYTAAKLSVALPDTVDWRTAGAVSFVKDQVSKHNMNTHACTRLINCTQADVCIMYLCVCV